MRDKSFSGRLAYLVLETMNRSILRSIVFLLGSSTTLAGVTYAANFALFSSNRRVSPVEVTFVEGILFIIAGILLFLGSGGINRASQQAALLVAAAGAISGDQIVGPSEILRRDAWKPEGFTFVGLVLTIAGILLIAVYFVSLYVLPR